MLEEFSTRRELNMEIRFISHSSACSDSKRSLKAITSYQVISTGNGFGLEKKRKAQDVFLLPLDVVKWPQWLFVKWKKLD